MTEMLHEAEQWDRKQTAGVGHSEILKLFGRVYRNGRLIKISNEK